MKITFDASTNEILSELGSRIRAARIAADLTQKQMAERTGLSQRTIGNLEAGRDAAFSTIIEVLRVLGRVQSLELLVPEAGLRPSQLASLGKPRERASRAKKQEAGPKTGWRWGDET